MAALSSRKRKAIRRERRDALANGIAIDWLTGREITEAHWDAFFAFYMDTGSRKWGRPYLNRRFFSLIGERMATGSCSSWRNGSGRYIAGAINFIGDTQALRAQLGLRRGPPVPAFRGLLLPGHRIRHRTRARSGRGRRAGRAQAGARLPARHHLIGSRHCRSLLAKGCRGLSGAGTSLCGGGRGRVIVGSTVSSRAGRVAPSEVRRDAGDAVDDRGRRRPDRVKSGSDNPVAADEDDRHQYPSEDLLKPHTPAAAVPALFAPGHLRRNDVGSSLERTFVQFSRHALTSGTFGTVRMPPPLLPPGPFGFTTFFGLGDRGRFRAATCAWPRLSRASGAQGLPDIRTRAS